MTDAAKPYSAEEIEQFRAYAHELSHTTGEVFVSRMADRRILATLAAVEAERDELQATFDLSWAAQMRGIQMFRDAHPDYPENRWPSTDTLFAWLAADRDDVVAERDEAVALIAEIDKRCTLYGAADAMREKIRALLREDEDEERSEP